MQTIVAHHIRHGRLSKMGEIYSAISLKVLGLSIVSVFIPIYLYVSKYSFVAILGFYVIDYSVHILIQPLAGRFISRFGPKHGFIVAAFGNIATLLMFATLPHIHWSIWELGVVTAIGEVFHFLSYYIGFTLAQDKDASGRQVGFLMQLQIIVTALGPFVGGVIGTLFGFTTSLVVAIFLALGSLLPLFVSSEPHMRQTFSLRSLPWRDMFPDLLSSAGKGIDNRVANIIWPIALFLVFKTYAEVGFITSLSFILTLVSAKIATEWSDKKGHQMLVWSSWLSAVIHLFRIIAQTLAGSIVINLVDGLVNWFGAVPWQTAMYRRARHINPVSYLVAFNLVSDFGTLVFWVILLLAALLLPISSVLVIGFVLGAIGVMASPIILRPRAS